MPLELFWWGSDFPHSVGTFPHSRKYIEETFADLDAGAAAHAAARERGRAPAPRPRRRHHRDAGRVGTKKREGSAPVCRAVAGDAELPPDLGRHGGIAASSGLMARRRTRAFPVSTHSMATSRRGGTWAVRSRTRCWCRWCRRSRRRSSSRCCTTRLAARSTRAVRGSRRTRELPSVTASSTSPLYAESLLQVLPGYGAPSCATATPRAACAWASRFVEVGELELACCCSVSWPARSTSVVMPAS